MKTWLNNLKENSTPSFDECVSVLKETFPWLSRLQNTPQDIEWHGEGDVHIHTGMVLDELYKIIDNVKGERRQALILGTALHDIAKCISTKEVEINGITRVVAPHHETEGRSYLAFKIMSLGLPYNVVQTVLALVGEHHKPKLLVTRNLDKADYCKLARVADCELLYLLEMADMKGRICPDTEQQIGYLEMFKMFAQEYGVWQTSDPYVDWRNQIIANLPNDTKETQNFVCAQSIRDFEEKVIAMPEESIAKSYGYRESYSNLVIMCGPSGAGKSTWIANNLAGYTVVSLDQLRLELTGKLDDQSMNGEVMQEAKKRLKSCLAKHENVVWDATSLRFDFRDMICQLGFNYNSFVTLVVFHFAEKHYYIGNKNRKNAIPDAALEKQIRNTQWPVATEVHDYKVVTLDAK